MKRLSAPWRRDDLLLVRIDPPLVDKSTSLETSIELVALATRHLGRSLFPVSEWPLSVHLGRILIEHPESQETLEPAEIRVEAWVLLNRTEEEARANSIGELPPEWKARLL